MLLAVEPFLFKLLENRETEIPKLKALIEEVMYTSIFKQDSLERMVFLRKFTGHGKLAGILDYLPPNSRIIEYNKVNNISDYEHSFIIGPMNMDELTLFYRKILQQELSIYPLTHLLINSKFYRNIMFYPYVPKMVFIPQDSFFLLTDFDFDSFFRKNNVKRVIIKDEFGFHTGQILPYRIVPTGKINEEIQVYREKTRIVEDIGGIIIEEFLAKNVSNVYKCHIFGEIIPQEILKYKVTLDGLEGIFKASTSGKPQLLRKVEVSVGTINESITNILNPRIKQYLPYAFSSIDFLIQANKPVVIDVNSKAGSLGEIQERQESNDHNPFEFFYRKCLEYQSNEYQRQTEYLNKISEIDNKIRLTNGIFTISEGNIAIDLLTEKKYDFTLA